MKKFLKILLIIIGIVFLIFAALICIGLFVDYDDHIENGRYTYVPEDDNKDNACMNREKYMSDWFTSEQEEADKMMEQIIEACRKQDTQKLKELFSENSRKNIKNIDVKINELFQYLKGDIQTFEGDCASSSDSDHGKKIIELDGMYNISTSSEKYHMNFYMYSQNDSDSKAVGLYKIEIALESEVAEDNFIWDNPPNGIFVGGQN